MASKREAGLAALFLVIDAISGPDAVRNGVVPTDVPAGGLIVQRDGEVGEPESVTLSPLTYHYEHLAELEVYVKDDPATTRDGALDAILVAISAAVAVDRTLSGAVDDCRVSAPLQLSEEALEGTDDLKRCLVPVTLTYSTTDPLN